MPCADRVFYQGLFWGEATSQALKWEDVPDENNWTRLLSWFPTLAKVRQSPGLSIEA